MGGESTLPECVCLCYDRGTLYFVCFRLQPYDSDYEVDVAIKSRDSLDVSVSGCSPVSLCDLRHALLVLLVCLSTFLVAAYPSQCTWLSLTQFSMLREIEFSSSGSKLPFTQSIHIGYSEYHFNDVCFY